MISSEFPEFTQGLTSKLRLKFAWAEKTVSLALLQESLQGLLQSMGSDEEAGGEGGHGGGFLFRLLFGLSSGFLHGVKAV